MAPRLLRCAIEQIEDWHSTLFVEPHAVAFVMAQARDNPFGWEAYVVVCAFSSVGHRIRFSKHPLQEAEHGEG